MESFGIFTVYKTGTKRRKVNKIDFYKFIWVFWKKKMNIFLGYFFSVADTKKKKKFWTVIQYLNMNIMGFVEFWKVIPVFAQGKEL